MLNFNKYQYVELQINVGQGTANFTPQQYLQNRPIYGIEVFNGSDLNGSKTNVAVVTAAMMSGIFLNFYCTDVNLPQQAIPNSTQTNGQNFGLWFRDVPAVAFHRVSQGTNGYVRDFYGMYGPMIDFEQSYANISAATQALITTAAAPQVLILGVSYK